jgi:hypothetical protein
MTHWVLAQANEWLGKEHIANAFGLVLYTDRHSNTATVLADEIFWCGLNERTGERWPVFVLKRPAGHPESGPFRPGELAQTIELNDDSLEAAHAALKEALDAATRAIEDVDAANLKSAEGLQAAIDLSLTDLKQRRWIKKALPLVSVFRKLFGAH